MLLLGSPFTSATLSVCKATGGDTLDYLVVKMANGLISGVTFRKPGRRAPGRQHQPELRGGRSRLHAADHGGTGAVVTMNYKINKAAKG